MNAYDAEIIEAVLQGIHEKRKLRIVNFSRKSGQESEWKVIPMKLYISTQGGRNYILCMGAESHRPLSYRIDYIRKVVLEEVSPDYDRERERFAAMVQHMWGVISSKRKQLEHIEMEYNTEEETDVLIQLLTFGSYVKVLAADGTKYLVIHSGSKNLGKQVTEIYQQLAINLNRGYGEYLEQREEIIRTYKEQGRRAEIQQALKQLKWQVHES